MPLVRKMLVHMHGEPGTGKTLAAEAVGFETGKPLKVYDWSSYSTVARVVKPVCTSGYGNAVISQGVVTR